MPDRVRLLLVEDSAEDAELVLRAATHARGRFEHRLVHTEAGFRRDLEQFRPHIVLSDFSLPRFGGLEALEICRDHDPDIPFIFVSGAIGDDVAVDAMKAGSSDYVMKSNLARLGPAVERELREAVTRRARRVAEAGLRRAQLMARLAHVVTGPDGEFESWSETLAVLTGLDAAAVPRSTRDWLALVHPEDRPTLRATMLKAATEQARADVEYRMRGADGAWIYIRQVIEPLERDAEVSGKYRWFNTLQDVTEEARSRLRITRLNRVYAVLSGINTLIVRVRSRDELFREACRIAVEHGQFPKAWIGLAPGASTPFRIAAAHGGDPGYFEMLEPKVRERLPTGRGLVVEALAQRHATVSNDIERDPGILLREELLAAGTRAVAVFPLLAAGRALAVLVLNADTAGFFDDEEMRLLGELAGDLSFALENLEKSDKLDYLSYYDPLTGLANRTLFHERLTQALAAARRDRGQLALLLVDLERFRAVNDSLGRQAGDALLKGVADRLIEHARDATWLARIDADHFALFIPDVPSAEELARRTEERMDRVFGAPYVVAGTELRIAARIGIALYPSDAADADTLFRNAEAALKKAKQTGERYLFYQHEMTARVAESLALENKLRRALERGEFVLHYQPKVDVETRRVVGLEALIRWMTDGELVPPARFVPLMEATGLILEAGAWALRRAALDHRALTEQGLAAPRIAVNVSAIQLRKRDFVDTIRAVTAQGSWPPGIDLEITESLVMENLEQNLGKLAAVRDLGLQIAVDDFGTGYSSLSYLARLPVHALKIDRSFIVAMIDDPKTMTLVSTIVSLGHSLNLRVIAEGVDAEEQARALRALGCDQMQGYLFSRPVPLDQIPALLRAAG